ncbi:uncharacterized protein LOC120422232 [Culex pipiens pallens]|uniref:uncharacterized protein LOC120422232 n=1 Tax=Culex pipiens pallens TaxID=42434 RepID=UPI0022AA9921|nr:uncharacterized protein LOC120422232 [Culex pipiens pallens]
MIRFLAFAAALPLVPVISIVMVGLSLYRALVAWIIGHKFKGRYAGMLAGSDVIWGLDEDRNSGVVNVLGFAEGSLSEQAGRTPQQIVAFLTERFEVILKNRNNEAFRKLFLQRNRSLGFYFWTRAKEVKLSDYIRLVRINENATVTEKEICDYVTKICNRKLFRTNNNAWELLVGTQYIEDSQTNLAKYPVLFRFHHSLGDGISIMRFILDEVVDQRQDSIDLTKTLSTVGKRHNTTFWSNLKAFYNAPSFVLRVLFSSEEPNSLHVMVPTPEKIICWQNENFTLTRDCWNHILENVGQISPKPSYSNTLLAVLSGTFFGYFASTEQYPNSLTIAMPTRVQQEAHQVNLKNTFATPMQQLKISPQIDLQDPNRLQRLLKKLSHLQQTTNRLRSSSDTMLTHQMMSTLPSICPLPVLRLLSNLFRITASVSIMPPLKHRLRLGPYELSDVYFWPPAFGSVGVNLTAFSYGGQLRLTLLADRTLFRTSEEGQTLLNEFFSEMGRMERVLSEC